MKFHKYDMDLETANQTLQNVFAACNQTPNTIPFEKIILQKKAKTAAVATCKWISVVFLIATLLSPLCFYRSISVHGTLETLHHISIEEHYFENDCFTIKFKGDNIDYDNISIMDEGGTIDIPDEIIPSENIIRLYHPTGTTNIWIPDHDGHNLTVVLSINEDD